MHFLRAVVNCNFCTKWSVQYICPEDHRILIQVLKCFLLLSFFLEFKQLSPDSAKFMSQTFRLCRRCTLKADIQNHPCYYERGSCSINLFQRKKCFLVLSTGAAIRGWLGFSPAHLQARTYIWQAWIWFTLKLELHSLLSLIFAHDRGTLRFSLFLQVFCFARTKPFWEQESAFELSCICTRARSLALRIQSSLLTSEDLNAWN